MRNRYYTCMSRFLRKQFLVGERYKYLRRLVSFEHAVLCRRSQFLLKKKLYKFLRFLIKFYYKDLFNAFEHSASRD